MKNIYLADDFLLIETKSANKGTSHVTQRMANLGTSPVVSEIIAELYCQIKWPTKIQAFLKVLPV